MKKIVLGTLLIGVIAVLVVGAVIRTRAKTDDSTGGRGGARQNQDQDVTLAGQGRNQGNGQPQDDRAEAEVRAEAGDWHTLHGVVDSVDDEALVVACDDGRQVLVEGMTWLYAQEQGFTAQTGDSLTLRVFAEDDELKAGWIDNQASAQSIDLRLEDGTPLWSGQGRNQGGDGGDGQRGQGGGTGQGRQGSGASGGLPAPEWLAYRGVVDAVDGNLLTILSDDGETVLVAGHAWRFAQEQGFTVQVGDTVALTGFYEDGEFKPGLLDNLTGARQITLRDEQGRPAWSGRGGA